MAIVLVEQSKTNNMDIDVGVFMYAASVVMSGILLYSMFLTWSKAYKINNGHQSMVQDRILGSPTYIEDEVAQAVKKQKSSLLSGAFVYDINIIDISSNYMILNRGERMANNLYIHFMSDVINTLIVPGLAKPLTITAASVVNSSKLRFEVSASSTVMNFVSPPSVTTAPANGYKQVLGVEV